MEGNLFAAIDTAAARDSTAVILARQTIDGKLEILDGISLTSTAHPQGTPLHPWRPPMLRRESLEYIEIKIEMSGHQREVNEAYAAFAAGVEFNEGFDKPALIRLARERCEARMGRKAARRRRYERRAQRQAGYRYCHWSKLIVTAEEIADNLYGPGL